jgi:hypothetical protein
MAIDQKLINYEIIANEIESCNVDKGLWAKAYALGNGLPEQQKILYTKYRLEQLNQATIEESASSAPKALNKTDTIPESHYRGSRIILLASGVCAVGLFFAFLKQPIPAMIFIIPGIGLYMWGSI